MFKFQVVGSLVVFSKFFAAGDREAVLAAIPEGTRRVVFIDTPATRELVQIVWDLSMNKGCEVLVRDHHDEPKPTNPRAEAIADAAAKVRLILGENAVISDRRTNPACSSLIEVDEFAEEGTVIIADPDADGLTAAMKACGVVYPELDSDAAVLDGPRAEHTADRLSPLGLLLTRAMSALPAFDANRPQVSEDAKGKLFVDFVAVVQGDLDAKTRLEKAAEQYEAKVAESTRLAETVVDVLSGVAFVDCTSAAQFDLGVLAAAMDRRPGTVVTVQRKGIGPIAAKHGGVQYSMAVVKAHQAAINLQELLPSGFVSSPEAGVISNTSFLLHVSEAMWNETILPALAAKLSG